MLLLQSSKHSRHAANTKEGLRGRLYREMINSFSIGKVSPNVESSEGRAPSQIREAAPQSHFRSDCRSPLPNNWMQNNTVNASGCSLHPSGIHCFHTKVGIYPMQYFVTMTCYNPVPPIRHLCMVNMINMNYHIPMCICDFNKHFA